MSPEAALREVTSMDAKDRNRFLAMLLSRRSIAKGSEDSARQWVDVMSATTKWYSAEDLDALIESGNDENDDTV